MTGKSISVEKNVSVRELTLELVYYRKHRESLYIIILYFIFIACVKDLIRALRGDNDQCEIRRHLGKAQVLQKVVRTYVHVAVLVWLLQTPPLSLTQDLMPLLVHYSDDMALRNDVIR